MLIDEVSAVSAAEADDPKGDAIGVRHGRNMRQTR
jgi:hypothetical protein